MNKIMKCSCGHDKYELFYKTYNKKYYICKACLSVLFKSNRLGVLVIEATDVIEFLPSIAYEAYTKKISKYNILDGVHYCLQCNSPIYSFSDTIVCPKCGFEWEVLNG